MKDEVDFCLQINFKCFVKLILSFKVFVARHTQITQRAFVDFSWIKTIFSWVNCGSKIFLVGISWVQNYFSWVFCGFKCYSRGYFAGPIFFFVGTSWVQISFS